MKKVSFLFFKATKNREFITRMLEEINIIRANPQEYLTKIKYFEQHSFIKNKNISFKNWKQNVVTSQSNLNELNKVLCSSEVLSSLVFNSDLCIHLPHDPRILQSYDFMANQFVMKKIGLAHKFQNLGFHSEFCSRDAQLAVFLQILDNNNIKIKRKNLLNQNFSDIGISVSKISEDLYACYFLLAGK